MPRARKDAKHEGNCNTSWLWPTNKFCEQLPRSLSRRQTKKKLQCCAVASSSIVNDPSLEEKRLLAEAICIFPFSCKYALKFNKVSIGSSGHILFYSFTSEALPSNQSNSNKVWFWVWCSCLIPTVVWIKPLWEPGLTFSLQEDIHTHNSVPGYSPGEHARHVTTNRLLLWGDRAKRCTDMPPSGLRLSLWH